MTDLVPTEEGGPLERVRQEDELGYKEQRKAILSLLTSHTGMRHGEAQMIFNRIEYALDCATQEAAPDGPTMVRAMKVGLQAFIQGSES